MIDGNGVPNTLHFYSARCKRVTRSVVAAEQHATVSGFGVYFVMCELIKEVLG